MTPRVIPASLLHQLSKFLGAHSARQEFKWMQDHAASIQAPSLHAMLNRRLAGEPLQYILGTQPFGALEVKVRAPVLIPRPETEDWTLRLARQLPASTAQEPIKVLDLCTGTGCIPLLVGHMRRTSPSGSLRALGIDIASQAIDLARENADLTKALLNENPVSFLQADILSEDFPTMLRDIGWSPVDVLTSNPPYVPLHEYKTLPSSVKVYEDPRALLGDPNPQSNPDSRGLTFYQAIAQLVHDGLVKPGGLIALEVGHNQSAEVQDLMQTQGRVRKTEIWKDPWGVERTVVCTK